MDMPRIGYEMKDRNSGRVFYKEVKLKDYDYTTDGASYRIRDKGHT
jgi:hypothetical protein